jgi:hypothetical protein
VRARGEGDDLWTDSRRDATFVRPADIIEASWAEDVATEASEDEMV